ncbi:MAG: hypothetical protein IKT52_13760 [Oscillospiraceae bacterium]|nr:hypothetical protein [Oscillospiraceae bacterium]
MASLIKGATILLYERTQTGVDAFNCTVYAENPVEVKNVLICPASTDDIVGDTQLHGKHAVYELCIPKDDTHVWEDRTVEFFGKKWRTFGIPQQWIPENLPHDWNMRVKVERYG